MSSISISDVSNCRIVFAALFIEEILSSVCVAIKPIVKFLIEAKSLKDLEIVKESIEEYFDNYSSKTFSDVRIFERVKNNYKKVTELYEKKLEKYNSKDIEVCVKYFKLNDMNLKNLIYTMKLNDIEKYLRKKKIQKLK